MLWPAAAAVAGDLLLMPEYQNVISASLSHDQSSKNLWRRQNQILGKPGNSFNSSAMAPRPRPKYTAQRRWHVSYEPLSEMIRRILHCNKGRYCGHNVTINHPLSTSLV
jgi:hypothetical protein